MSSVGSLCRVSVRDRTTPFGIQRGDEIDDNSEAERNGKPPGRPGSELAKDRAGDQGCDVGVHSRHRFKQICTIAVPRTINAGACGDTECEQNYPAQKQYGVPVTDAEAV